MRGALTIGRVAGIEIRIHPSWLIIFALVTWSLAVAYFPTTDPAFGPGTSWALGLVAALLLFGSVLLHELSHSLVARARGCGVHSITLFIFGGVSSLEQEPRKPAGELIIAAVGPLTSLLLAGLAFGLSAALVSVSPGATAVLGYLAMINLALGLFNLIPGFPLDGGRVLRSIVWQLSGSFQRATRVAASVGQLVAYGFILWGVLQVFGGNVLGGIWIAMIGWFLASSAEASAQQVTLEDQIAGVRVADVMRREPVAADADLSVQTLVDEYLLRHNLRAVPVLDGDRLIGIATLGDLQRLPREAWGETPARALLADRDGQGMAPPEAPLTEALRWMAEAELERLPVISDGRLVGILSRSDVLRYLQLREALAVTDQHDKPAGDHARAARAAGGS